MSRNFSVSILLVTGFLVTPVGCAQEREIIFSDDFSDYAATKPAEQAKELAKKWAAFSGHWYVKDGTLHQDAGSFDYGIVVKDMYLRCDYEIEAKVRLVKGGSGAGWYWNVYDQQTGDSGNMLRYDGINPIMYGWLRGRGFVGTGGATGNLGPDGKWHTMKMVVKNSQSTFDMYWDGEKIIDGAIQFHGSGYVGLECSMGHCEFDDVVVSVVKGTDWKAAPYGKVNTEWVSSLTVLPDGNIAYPIRNMHCVQVVTPDGKLVREFGKRGSGKGQLNLPAAVAADKAGNIYVSEAGNKRVQVFDAKGNSTKLLAPAGKNALVKPGSLTVDSNGRVWVVDNSNRVVCLSPDGAVVASHGGPVKHPAKPMFKGAREISTVNANIYVTDPGNSRVMIFNAANPAAGPVARPVPGGVVSVAFNGKDKLAALTTWSVQVYNMNWTPVGKPFTGSAIGGLCANSVAYDKDGNILVADGWFHRIVMVSSETTKAEPEITNITPTTAVASWTTDVEMPTRLMLLDTPQGSVWGKTADYSKARVLGDGNITKHHRVALTGLKPATRYCFAIDSPYKTIPSSGHSRDYRFATAAPAGKMTYTEVPIAILCYGNVIYESRGKGKDGKFPKPTIRDEEWLEGRKVAHEGMRQFYWTNSLMQLDTKCKYMLVKRPVDYAYLGSSSEEVYKDLATLAKREGLKPEDFGAVLVLGGKGTYAYPWPTPWWGGKLTYTTGACFCGWGDMWIGTHEFHHDTEGWMRMIGDKGAGYICADTPWVSKGRYGENYDFLAWTLRIMPRDTYVNLAVGKIRVTDDKDGDGVPDADPNVPWDELRGETSPNDRESYKNGLTDLQSLTAETFTAAVKGHKHPLLTKQIDLKYPFAVFNYDYERHMKTPKIDGVMNKGEWDLFTQSPTPTMTQPTKVHKFTPPPADRDYRMKSYLNWDDEYLYFAFAAPYKFATSIQLDCKGDGYFHGHDNPRMSFGIPRDESKAKPNTLLPPPGVMVWNNTEPVKQFGGPNWTNKRFDTRDKIKWAWSKNAEGWYVIEVAIPKTPSVDLVPKDGQEMGVRLWTVCYLPPTEKNKNPYYVFEMFDSCEYGYFKLVK